MLEVQHITKIYNPGTVHETCLFKDFSLKIEQGSFASVVGIRLFMPKREEREEVPPKWKQWLWRLWQSVALTRERAAALY